MPITKEQAEILKQLVDEDANLVGANLKLKEVPDYDDFYEAYEAKFKKPRWGSSSLSWARWNNRKDRMWDEIVNQVLLPENVIGACVIGGLTIAALKAGYKVQLKDLLDRDMERLSTNIPLDDVGRQTKKALQEFTGLTFNELLELQQINDRFDPTDHSYYDEAKGQYVANPVYGKSEKEATTARRKALKNKIKSFIREV